MKSLLDEYLRDERIRILAEIRETISHTEVIHINNLFLTHDGRLKDLVVKYIDSLIEKELNDANVRFR